MTEEYDVVVVGAGILGIFFLVCLAPYKKYIRECLLSTFYKKEGGWIGK